MYKSSIYDIEALDKPLERTIGFLKSFETACLLNSNQEFYPPGKYSFSNFSFLAAAGVIKEVNSALNHDLSFLQKSIEENGSWHMGFMGYDLKNKIEKLNSNNTDHLFWPDLYFFQPKYILRNSGDKLEILCHFHAEYNSDQVFQMLSSSTPSLNYLESQNVQMTARLSKEEYLSKVEKLKEHIRRGDIYEVNFCQEFYAQHEFDAFSGYLKLCQVSPTPYSSFFRLKNRFLLSASPERFLTKKGNQLISQPIKGTSPRGKDAEEDLYFKEVLKTTKKERSENIMIVDLVRNDLSRISKKGTVKVEELCGIYSFKQLHHMISTISAETDETSIEKIIKATFPMGSMTGAPKIKAMRLAEKYETTKRGLYSGTVGYFAPNKNFDFNVVIRSLQYNADNKYLSYMVGGAITFLSDPEKEYEECLVKASGIEQMLKS